MFQLNLAAPLLDLSIIYGHDGPSAARGRAPGGRLLSEPLQGKEWPPNGGAVCLLNQRPQETRCHNTSEYTTTRLASLRAAVGQGVDFQRRRVSPQLTATRDTVS